MENKVNNINAVYNRLNNEQKKICEVIFRGITQKQLTEKDASHPTSLKELADMAEVSPEQCQEVVQLFVQENGIIVTTENGMLQLSYDQYMQDWKLLQTWMQTEADLVKEYLKWAKVAEQHQAGKEGLLIDADLKQALAIKDAHKPNSAWGIRYHPHYEQTLSYLDFCRKSEEDEINSRKKLAEHRKGIFSVYICLSHSDNVGSTHFQLS